MATSEIVGGPFDSRAIQITPTPLGDRQTVALTTAGLVFMVVSAVAVLALIWQLSVRRDGPGLVYSALESSREATRQQSATPFVTILLAVYIAPMVLFGAALFSASVGYVLLRTAGAATRETIPRQDYELLSRLLFDNNTAGIEQYIRLSSLGGFAGLFQKIGLSGLPLATIGLTVIFTILSLAGGGKEIFDLAKLTLGAFIGSYVQRSVTERIASGEERPRSSPPPPAGA
jgi:hypothetical protein